MGEGDDITASYGGIGVANATLYADSEKKAGMEVDQ